MSKIKTNKSPGHDGLTFLQNAKSMLLNSFNYGFENKELAFTHREYIISLMFKKGERYGLKMINH